MGHVGGSIQGIGAGALLVFPFAAEFDAVVAALPGDVVGEDVAAAQPALRRIGLVAENHARAFHGDVRAAETDAAGTDIRAGRRIAISPEGGGVAELVHGCGANAADERENSGVGPVHVGLPSRWQ